MRRGLILGSALILTACAEFVEVSPLVVIWGDHGGYVDEYAEREIAWRHAGVKIVIAGRCASACTLYLHSPTACVLPTAEFMFHVAYAGVPLPGGVLGMGRSDSYGTKFLYDAYPAGVRAFIDTHGGMRREPLQMTYAEARAAGVPACL
jgi:hypothetical protein